MITYENSFNTNNLVGSARCFAFNLKTARAQWGAITRMTGTRGSQPTASAWPCWASQRPKLPSKMPATPPSRLPSLAPPSQIGRWYCHKSHCTSAAVITMHQVPCRSSARAASMPKPDYKQETMEGEMRAYVTKQQRGRSSRLFNVEDTTGPGFACELQQRML